MSQRSFRTPLLKLQLLKYSTLSPVKYLSSRSINIHELRSTSGYLWKNIFLSGFLLSLRSGGWSKRSSSIVEQERTAMAVPLFLPSIYIRVLNPSPPSLPIYTFYPIPSRQPSALDIAIVSSTLSPLSVFTSRLDMRKSDHTPIEFTVGLEVSKVKFFSHKLKLTPFQQTMLEATIESSAQSVANQLGEMCSLNPLQRYNFLLTSLADAINSILPPTRRFPVQTKP